MIHNCGAQRFPLLTKRFSLYYYPFLGDSSLRDLLTLFYLCIFSMLFKHLFIFLMMLDMGFFFNLIGNNCSASRSSGAVRNWFVELCRSSIYLCSCCYELQDYVKLWKKLEKQVFSLNLLLKCKREDCSLSWSYGFFTDLKLDWSIVSIEFVNTDLVWTLQYV